VHTVTLLGGPLDGLQLKLKDEPQRVVFAVTLAKTTKVGGKAQAAGAAVAELVYARQLDPEHYYFGYFQLYGMEVSAAIEDAYKG